MNRWRNGYVSAALVALLLVILDVNEGRAQDDLWGFQAEVGASVFFGATDQTTITNRLSAERADSTFEISSQWNFNFGRATDDMGESFINKRSWVFQNALDYRPFAKLSPFLQSRLEKSFEKRIDFRYDIGVGGKYAFIRDDITRLDFSLAILAEETMPSDDVAGAEDELLARWSARFRYRRIFGEDRLTFESVTFYRPEFSEFGNYTLSSVNSLAVQLNSSLSLKLALIDNYDSLAEERGARSNNDGQFTISLLSAF